MPATFDHPGCGQRSAPADAGAARCCGGLDGHGDRGDRPSPSPPEADTYVTGADPTSTHGGDPFMDVYGGAFSYGCGTGPSLGLLRFDLSSLPAGATIVDASLDLTSRAGFAFDGDPEHYAIYLPDDSWNEGTVSWNTRPADGLAGQPAPAGLAALRRARRHLAVPGRPHERLHGERLRRHHADAAALLLGQPDGAPQQRAAHRPGQARLARGHDLRLRHAVRGRLPERPAPAVVLPALRLARVRRRHAAAAHGRVHRPAGQRRLDARAADRARTARATAPPRVDRPARAGALVPLRRHAGRPRLRRPLQPGRRTTTSPSSPTSARPSGA